MKATKAINELRQMADDLIAVIVRYEASRTRPVSSLRRKVSALRWAISEAGTPDHLLPNLPPFVRGPK